MCSSIELTENEEWKESLGRLAFMVIAVIVFYSALRICRGKKDILDRIFAQFKWGKIQNVKFFIKFIIVGFPVFLFSAAMAGYYYTALRFGINLYMTANGVFLAIFFGGIASRWILLTRRKLAREQAQKKRALLKAQQEATSETISALEEDILDLDLVDVQASRLVRGVTFVGILIAFWFIWGDMLPALEILNKVEIGHTIETISEPKISSDGVESTELISHEIPITLKHLLVSVLIAFLTVVATRNIPGLLELTVLQRLQLAAGERYAITSIVRYVIVGLGVMLTFNAVGIGWSRVQWLIAALSLGLGFGLQEIFANFVSGLILLFERPIRIGDTVTVGGVHGTVTRIRIRATTITDFDRKELVVPNKEFITNQLVNWTLSDAVIRVIIPVGVSYDSDVDMVCSTLIEVVNSCPIALKEPVPQALFLGFGDSTLNFELRVHCNGIDDYLPLKHWLHMGITKTFRAKDIEIAYPQRDLHIRSSEVPFRDEKKKPH